MKWLARFLDHRAYLFLCRRPLGRKALEDHHRAVCPTPNMYFITVPGRPNRVVCLGCTSVVWEVK